MRLPIDKAPTAALAAGVAAIDVGLWTGVVPFELFARHLTAAHASPVVLIGVLVVNAGFIGLMTASTSATAELLRRGLSVRGVLSRISSSRA